MTNEEFSPEKCIKIEVFFFTLGRKLNRQHKAGDKLRE